MKCEGGSVSVKSWALGFHLFHNRRQYGDQLVALGIEFLQPFTRNDIRVGKQPQPIMGFARLLAGNAVFADKIRLTLGSLPFFDIRTDGCPGPQELISQYSGTPGVSSRYWQSFTTLFANSKLRFGKSLFILLFPVFFHPSNFTPSHFVSHPSNFYLSVHEAREEKVAGFR